MDNKLLEDYLKGIKTTTSTNTNDFLSSYLQKPIVMTKPYVKPKSLLNEYLKPTVTATVGIGNIFNLPQIFEQFEEIGTKTLAEHISKFSTFEHPIPTPVIDWSHIFEYAKKTAIVNPPKNLWENLEWQTMQTDPDYASRSPNGQAVQRVITYMQGVMGAAVVAITFGEGIKIVSTLRDSVIGELTDSVKTVQDAVKKIGIKEWNGVDISKVTPKSIGAINDAIVTRNPELAQALNYLITVKDAFPDEQFAYTFNQMINGYLGKLPYLNPPVPQQKTPMEQVEEQVNQYLVGKTPPIKETYIIKIGEIIDKLTPLSKPIKVEIPTLNSIVVGAKTQTLSQFTSVIKNLIPVFQKVMNTYSGITQKTTVSKEQLNEASTFLSTFKNDKAITNVYNKVTGKVGVPIKEVKPITSIKPVEILKSVPEVWKTENADVLVNKLDINQLRSLKNLFDKVLAGEKLTVSEKSAITKNHIMELNKETNKYELTIGEYQGKFLYDTIRGKIVRLQMTQKEIPAEVKPVAKVAKEVKPEPKPEKAIQPTQPAEVPQKIRTFRFNGNIKTGEAIGNFGGKNNFKVGETIKIIGNDATRIGIVKTAGKGFWRIELTTPAEQAVTKVPEVKAEVAKEPTKVTLQRIIPNPRGDNEIKDIQLIKETSKSFKVWLPTEKKYQLIPKSEWQIKPEVAKVKEKVPIVKEEVKVAEKPVKVYGKADAHFVSKAVSGNNIDTPIKLTGRYLETVKGTKVEGLTQDSKSHWFFKKNILNPDEFSEYARWGALPDGKEVAVYYAGVEQFGKEFKVSQLNLPIGAETKSLTTEEITEHISKTIDPHEKVRKQLTSALKKMKLLKPKPNAKGVWVPSVDMQTIMKRYFPKETLNGILNSEDGTQTLMEIIDGMNKVKEATGEDVQLGRVGIASVVQSEWRTVQEVFGDYKLVDRTSYAGVKIIEYLNDANRSIQKLYKETINPVIKKYKINKADLFDILRHPERFPDLSQEVKDMAQKVITWNKVWQEDMADKLNIPLKYRIENHIFYQYEYLIREVLEDPQGDKSLPQSLLHGIADYKSSQPLAEFEDPALKKRTQEDGLGMIKDFYKATMASAEYGIRKYYLDPILNDMKKVWGKLDLKTQVHFKRWISEDLVGKTPYMEGLIRESGGKLDRLLTANLKKIINPKTHQPIFKGEVKDAVEKLINVTISATYMAFLSLYPKTALLQFFQKTAVVPLVSGYGFTFATKNWLNPKYRRFVSQNSNVYKLRKVERLAGMEESTRNKFLRILQNVTMFLFNMFDTDGVTFAFIAGYGEAKHYGLSEEVSIARGEEVARQSMYIYTKMFRSELARNVLGRAASMFTSFPINFAGLMADLLKGNVSNVYKKHFKEHPEELTGNRGKLVKKNYAGLIKYLLMLIGASLLQKKTRVRVTKYIGIDALFGLFNYNAAAFNVYKYAGNALYYLLVDWDPKKALAEFNKLSPSDQISLLRTLQYLGVYGNKKDIWNAILYMNKLPTIKITTPPGRTTRKGER